MNSPFIDMPVEVQTELAYPPVNHEIDLYSPFEALIHKDERFRTPVLNTTEEGFEILDPVSGDMLFEGEWDEVKNKTATDIAVGANNALWIISKEADGKDYKIYQWTAKGWINADGSAIRIAVTSNGTPWVITSSGKIYRREGSTWKEKVGPGGACKDIGIGGPKDSVWVIGGNGTGPDYAIHQWNSTNNTWQTVVGAGIRIAVASNGMPWVINSIGQIFRRDANRWIEVIGLKPGKDIGIGANDAVWVIGGNPWASNYKIHRWHANNTWQEADGAGISIAVGPDGLPYIVNAAGQIYKQKVTPLGYEDPNNSGIPLIKITDINKKQHLSKNFTVEEFARAGEYKWKYYRADTDLISELQRLRDELKKSITIVDGYYPPLYQKYISRKLPSDDPHFSGRGVKIRVSGMSGKDIAEKILIHCDPTLSVGVGDSNAVMHINPKGNRIFSYIQDSKKSEEVLRNLKKLLSGGVVEVIDFIEEEMPPALISLFSPENDTRITNQIIQDSKSNIEEVFVVIDKFMAGKSDADKTVTYLKTVKNFTKIDEDIAKLGGSENAKKLKEALMRDKSGLDLMSKLQLLKNSLGLIETITKLSSISEKKKKYEEFLKSNTGATIYLAFDLFEGFTKLTIDSVNLSLALACVLATDAATKAELLKTAMAVEQVAKPLMIAFEVIKIIRSVTNVIIAISQGNYQAIKDNLIDIGKSSLTIFTLVKLGSGIFGFATAIYLFYKFIGSMAGMVGDAVRAGAQGATIIAIGELLATFRRLTGIYLQTNLNYEKILAAIDQDYSKLESQSHLQNKVYEDFTFLYEKIHGFQTYIKNLYTSTGSSSGYYSSFASIPRRILEDPTRDLINTSIELRQYPKQAADFDPAVHPAVVNEYYIFFYEGVLKCIREIKQIYEERVEVGWDPLHHKESSIDLLPLQEYSEYDENPSFEIEQYEKDLSKGAPPVLIRRLYSGKEYSIFDPASNSYATGINEAHLQKSGLSIADIQSALSKTIDFNAIQQLFTSHNQLSPDNTYKFNPGSQDIDSVFTEAIHQFQITNYLDPNDHNGIIGRSTLETLSFINHGLKHKLNSSDFYGQKQLNHKEIKPQVPVLTNNEFTVANWYQFILKPAWLGVKITDGIHLLLLRKLREAETWLLSQPQYKGMTPAALGRALGFNEDTRYSGARLSANKQAMHGFGLALDINVSGNPWIGAGWVKHDKVLLLERTRMIKALRNAAGDNSLPGKTVFAYLDSIASTVGTDTSKAYSILKLRNHQFISYLKSNPPELSYWKRSQTFGNRNPLNGFLNLHPDLVYALRHVAGLAWGAIDFGPNASGDIMHFDFRTLGIGKLIAKYIHGYIPKSGHPAITKEIEDNELDYHEAIEEAEWSDDSEINYEEAVEEDV